MPRLACESTVRITSRSPLGTYYHDIQGSPLLNAEEERALARRIAQGDPSARDQMVRSNLRLVVRIAKDYLGRGLSLEDLVAEGNLGLLRAVEAFDPDLGNRFSTYAKFWIKQSIQSALRKYGTVLPLPSHAAALLCKWRRAASALAERLGRPPTDEEVERVLRLPPNKRATLAEALRVSRMTARHSHEDEDDSAPVAVLADDRARPPAEVLADSDAIETLRRRLDELEPKLAAVLRLRFGLDADGPATLSDVADRLNLTRGGVRQLEQLALQRLRNQPE